MDPNLCHAAQSTAMYIALQRRTTLIVFDLDGTISDSRELARESYKRVFALMGCGLISDEQADAFNGPDADEICRVMGIGADRRPLYDKLLEEIVTEFTPKLGRVFPGTVQMLQALAPRAHLAILTNGSTSYCRTSIRAFGLEPYIDLHSGYVGGVTKARRIGMWERELGVERVIVVGDRRTDIENARRVGAMAVGVLYGMGDRQELAGADALCETTQELRRTLLRLIEA